MLRFYSHWWCYWEAVQEPRCSWCYKPLCSLQPDFIHSLFKPSGSCVSCCDIADSLLTTVNLRPFKGKQSALQMTSSHQLSLLGHISADAVLCIFPCLISFGFGCLSVCLYVFLNVTYAWQNLLASFRSSCRSRLCSENRSPSHQESAGAPGLLTRTPMSHPGKLCGHIYHSFHAAGVLKTLHI